MPRPLLTGLALLLASPFASAQVVQAVFPAVGEPEDVVLVSGFGLEAVDHVAFTGIVGGFAGQLTLDVLPQDVSARRVLVRVPSFGAFAPPSATPPGQWIGFLQLSSAGQLSNAVSFGFLEATAGSVATIGLGGSDPPGFRPRIGFSLAGGLPAAPSPTFEPRLYAAPAGSAAILVVGLPALVPTPLYGGQSFVSGTGPALATFSSFPVQGPFGESFVPFGLPSAAAGTTLVLQWSTTDARSGQVAISNALRISL